MFKYEGIFHLYEWATLLAGCSFKSQFNINVCFPIGMSVENPIITKKCRLTIGKLL